MKLVVVGGNARKAGKTLAVSGIIRGLRSLEWTAVKITPHFHGFEPVRKSGTARTADRGFLLAEERYPPGKGDTARYLAAGAKRALLLRVQPGSMAEALPALRQELRGARFVVIESNSILNYLKPTVALFVLAEARRGIKPSARRLLRHADALVRVGRSHDDPSRREKSPDLFRTRPTFLASRGERINPMLCRFVRRRLADAEGDPWPRVSSPTHELKEPPWLH